MQNTSFKHSVKVPQLYKCAAKISKEVAECGSTIKQLVYEKKHFNTKALYALVVTAFQKDKEIDFLLKRTKLLEIESRLDPWLAKILISELLWGKKQLPKSDAKPIQTILAYEQAFHAHLSDSSEDALPVETAKFKKPRYVRINTLINPLNEALELFQDEGWILQTPKNDYVSFLDQVANLTGDFFLKDLHVPELLIFPTGTEFYNHPGYKKGALVLQDKASCLPVYLLSPPPGSVVLDMCAAPGMKTTQLATMLNNEGTVYATERDRKRFDVLNKIVETSGATCIKTINKDVLECGGADFPDVEYILVDPSCSASGMTDRLEIRQNHDQLKLQRLAGFQIKILRSALTRYPKVKKVVYSTCSLYPEENEDVVRQVLETNNQFKLVPAGDFINNAWKNFGSPDFGDIGKFCLYARPDEDLTNGFFIAVFERLEEGENNQFFNGRVLNYRKNVEQKQARKERKNRENVDAGVGFKEENGHGRNEKLLSNDSIENNDNSSMNATNDTSNKNKKNKRKQSDTESLNQKINYVNIELQEKSKKRKKIEMIIGEGNEEQANDNKAKNSELTHKDIVYEEIYETAKKSKKKKRKEKEDENFQEKQDLEVPEPDENIKQKNKKKKLKQSIKGFDNIDNIDHKLSDSKQDLRNFNQCKENTTTEKRKNKKQKYNEFVNLDEYDKEIKEMCSENTKQSVKNDLLPILNEEHLDITSNQKHKKKQKHDDAELVKEHNKQSKELNSGHLGEDFKYSNQDEADGIDKKYKKSKKKSKTFDTENLIEVDDEYQQLTNDVSTKSKKKKRKHSLLENTT